MSGPGRCQVCRHRPAAMVGAGYCFECWPGGPVTPPPCRRCRSSGDYYTAGLCARCHPRAPQRPDSCRDCHAWGATRTRKWLCKGCEAWRANHRLGTCTICRRAVAVDHDAACRLCRKQRSLVLRAGQGRATLADANRHGRQLFFADMARAASARAEQLPDTASPPRVRIWPVAHRQLVLFEVPLDFEAAARLGFPPPKDQALAAWLWACVADHAAGHGWSRSVTEGVQRGVRILLGTQHTAGAAIRASDVTGLSRIGVSARGVSDVLAAADMLEADRVPAIVRWFETHVAGLPEQMRSELGVWFDIKRNGSADAPRCRPRAEATIRSQLGFALPALRTWAAEHASLREISRDDVHAVLPAGGGSRSSMVQGLRSIFRVLKARQLVFVNPTARLRVPNPDRPAPRAVDLVALREALDSADSVRAALAGLLAFHAVRVWQLCEAQLTDVRDGRMYIGEQVILLAGPVRQRLAAYLDDRAERWPGTVNPHLFIHYRNANTTTAVTPWWIRRRLGMSAQSIRQDRILDEAHATAGDVRLVCDLFGLSVAGAYRYTATVDRLASDPTVG